MRKSYSLSFFKVVTLALMLFLPLYDFFVLSPIFTDFVIENLEQDSQQTAIHLGKMVSVNAEEISLSSINNNLGKVATGFLEDFKVRKVKVFSRSGETIFSTDKADLGKIHPDKSLWQHLSDGKTYSKTIKVNRFSLEG